MPGHRAFDAGPDGVNKRPIRHSEDSMGADSGRSCGRLRLRSDSLWRLPMSLDPHEEPAAIQTHIGAIFISLELSRSKWVITGLVPGGGQGMSKHWVEAEDLAGLLARFWAIRDKVLARTGITYPRFRGGVDAPRPTRSRARRCCGRCWLSSGVSRGCVRWCG